MRQTLTGLSLMAITIFGFACEKDREGDNVEPVTPIVVADNDHMLMGNPSNATVSVSNPNNYLMRKPYYTVSYSRDRGTPNWVSWHLYSSDLGTVSRSLDFLPDNTLPASWYHVQNAYYSNSGFDRGHNCPSGDRTSTTTANEATFLTTNLIPQAPKQNQQTWAGMEDYIRGLITASTEAYIIMGSYGKGGIGSTGAITNTISAGHITVPSNIWKVVVLMPNGNNDTTRVTAATRVISVNVPNNDNANTNWKTYRVSVNAIEAAVTASSGANFDLLSRLPASVQTAIEAVVDNK